MMTCIRCRQRFSEQDHQCLQEMTIEELFEESLREVRGRQRHYNPMKATMTFNGENIEGVAFSLGVPPGQAHDDDDFKP